MAEDNDPKYEAEVCKFKDADKAFVWCEENITQKWKNKGRTFFFMTLNEMLWFKMIWG